MMSAGQQTTGGKALRPDPSDLSEMAQQVYNFVYINEIILIKGGEYMSKEINIDLLDNVTGGVVNTSSDGSTSKHDILKQIEKIQDRMEKEKNPTTIMKLHAELKRLRLLYDSLR